MILQQGYVWVEEELNGVKTEKYSKVYIFAIPFCGILSVKHEPSETSLDLNSLIESHQHSGWLIGGSIDPIDLSVGDATEVENLDGLILHPLILTVKSDDSTCELSLFLESEDLRTAWKNSIEQLISTLTFLKSCMERDFSPIPSLYQVAHYAVQNHELILHQSALHPKALPTINHFFKLHQMNVLQRIELCDVQLSDQHITALNALLNTCSVRLKSLNLSQNLLTSKGVKLLCASLVTCSNLLALDLSSNLISDSSSACLSETLFQLSRLKRFVIAKNRLSSHSAKSLISRFGNYNSVTEDLDFSYNEIGDDIGFMIAFLFQNVPSVFKSANLACCGLTESSVLEIAKHIPTCASLTHLDISGCMVSAETTRTLMISISRHHVKYSNSSTRLLVRFGGIGVDNDRRSYSLPYQSLRAACFEVTDLTIFQEITLRRLRKLNRIDSFCCFRIESQSWWKNSWMGFLAILRNRLEDRLSTNHRNSLRVLSQTCLCATSHQTAYLFIALLDEDVKKEILTAMKASDSFFRVLNIKSLYLQDSFDGRNSVIENQLITNSGFGGKGFSDHYIPPLAPTDQFHPSFVSDEENIEFDPIMWTIDLPLGEDEIAEEKEEILSQSFSLNVKVEDEVDEGVFTKDYQTMLDYENSMREKRLVNERLVLAVRKLYQAREVSSSVAKFWEGMFGNKKHRSFAEKQLVLAMRLGHDRINDETSMELGLSHLFPSVARREQVYQAMYVRDVEEMQRLHSSLQPSTGGYAVVYSNRLTAEIVSLRQQFHNIQLLAKSYAELPLIEDFLLTCGKLSYTGKEMFEAVELRQKLFAHGMHKGGLSFSEMSTIIKIRSVMTNLLISRDFTALREKIVEWREDEELDVSIFPEISVAENMLNEYDQTMLNLRSAAEKKEIELIDLALSIAAYWNFFSKEVEDCLTVLNDISRNPAHLIRPIVEGLRKGKMSLVDKGFENLLKMGLSHEALDSVVCSKIHALKSRIIQDDSVRDKLVKVCLALKNGFHVAPGEIMQLYRKANAIKLNQDPSLKSYFKILQKHSKKFVSLQKQEKVIQQLIQSNDIYKLSKLLAGRGMGKLVMSFPTAFARDQWYNKFSLVCSGKAIGDNAEILESKDFKEEVVFQGTFEKAARSDDGKLRGWRKRFFLLKSVHLSYYTKVNGEKKGSIRVLNGGARVMEAHEANGKQFCIELEEGRDLSCVSPDLLEEARRHVRFAKIMEIESSLRKGIVLRSVSLLSKMLKFAEELEVMLDYNLMNEAKHSLQTLKVQQLRRDLYFASTTIPRSQILQELSNSANSFMLDPNLSSLKKVRFLLSKSEIEQEIYRCKSSIIHLKSANFLKSMKILTKIDFTQASTKLKSLFLSLILQFVGIRLLDLVQAGVVSFALMKYLKHALVLCHAYHVELEVMDIIRFILKLMTRYIPDIGSPLALNLLTSGSGGTSTSAAMAAPNDLHGLLEELYHFPKISAQYSIAKFPLLRLSSVQNQSSKLFGGFQRRRSSVMDEVMSHSATPIVKSLLKYEVNPLDNNIAVEAFTLLQCLMGEASIASFKKWKKSKILQNPPSHESILYDLLHLVLIRYPVLQDEVYFQLCKQLKLNPNPSSRLHGCWLLSIYLHAFVPSSEAFPYIKNQILQLLVDFSLKAVNGSQEHPVRGAVALESATAMLPTVSLFCQPISVDKVSDFEDQTFAESLANRLCREVCLYSYWLISQAEFYQYSSSSSFLSSSSLKLQKALTQNMDPGHVIRIFQYILSNQRFTFHVILLTGEVITLSLHYAQLTHQSLLVSLYDALFPKSLREYHREVSRRLKGTVDLGSQLELFNEYEGTGQPIKTASNEGEKRGDFDAALAEELWKDIQCAFDGFGFFRLSEAEISSPKVETDQHPRIDFMSIPVQPSFEQFVDWNQDLQWQFLEQYATSSEEMGEFVLGKQNAIVLRRFSMNSIELFTESDYEVFGCEVAETDQIQRCKFWKEWLVSAPNLPVSQSETTFGGANEVLPKDFLRVDLLFSEDTRYVNSRLALMSSESFHYLLAMQLALAWSDSELTGGSNFFSHNSPSVASCYCYTSIDDAINKANSLEKDFNMMSLNASRLEQQQGSSPPENENLSVSDDSEDLNLLAAIDHPQSMLNPLSGRKREDGDESESDYVSSEDELSLDEEIRWKPKPITLTQPMTEEEKDHLQFLLQELGINSEEDMEKSVSDNNLDVNHEQLWRLIGQFHQMPIQLGISVSSPKFRYYLKRAYHHYLVAITGLFYEQYLVNTTFTSLELDESIRNEHIEFQDRYINNFRKMDVLLGLSAQGIYLFSPKDWSIIFYSPYWDVTEYELSTLSHKQKQKRRPSAVGIDEENLRQLVLNISGLKLMFLGGKLDCALEVMNIYSKETLKKGAYPYGTRTNIDELLVINAYNDQHFPQAKVNLASSFSTASSSLAQNNNNTQGNHLFQLFLANYSLLPVPPMIDNHAFMRSEKFFVAPPSQREIIASTRYEEEKLEEEIMKLAEQILLEKNQQQITKGRNEVMHRSLNDEDDEQDEENIQEPVDSTDKEKSSGNLNRNVKLKRKNRSVFQGNRLKSNEEINQILLKDRLDAAVCGVFNKDSIFTQQLQLPTLPFRIKGKVKMPTTNGIDDSLDNHQQMHLKSQHGVSGTVLQLKEFQKKPVIESKRFPFVTTTNDSSLVWSGLTGTHSDPLPTGPIKRHESNVSNALKQASNVTTITGELENLWKTLQKDNLRLATADERGIQLLNEFNEKLNSQKGDSYSMGLSGAMWHHYQQMKDANPSLQPALEESQVDLSQLDVSRSELEI